MNPVLALICIWAFVFSSSYIHSSVKAVIAGEYKKFGSAFGMFVPFLIVFIDTFLRIFSVTHTGLW